MPVVTTLTDDANDTGSLRYALNNATSGDVITFAPGLAGGTISLVGTPLFIGTSLTIDGGAGITIDGQSQVTDFTVGPSRRPDHAAESDDRQRARRRHRRAVQWSPRSGCGRRHLRQRRRDLAVQYPVRQQ